MPASLKRHMSTKPRQRWSRRRGRDDGGQALIVVLILSVALITMVTFAVSSSIANLNSSANYANASQAQLTAYSGLSQATNAMAGKTIATLPCSWPPPPSTYGTMPLPRTAGGDATYSVTIAYFSDNAATVPLACNAGAPASAILTSRGTSPKTTPVTMKETVSVAATPQLLPAFAFAMFSPGTVQLTSNVAVDQTTCPPSGPPAPCASVYGGTLSECTNGTVIEGDVLSYSNVNVNSSCTIYGNLYVQGNVSISNTVHIKGNVYAYGGSVSLTSTPTIDGSIYAIAGSSGGGTINANTNAVTVHGNLDATGSITNISKATIGGSVVPNDAAIAGWTMPAQVPFPQMSPTPDSLSATGAGGGYHVIQVGNTLLGQVSCDVFFLPATLVSLIDSLKSTKTAIYAPTCTPSMTGLGILTPYIVSTDMIWVLGGFEANGTTDFVASPLTLTTYNLSIIVPYGTSCKKGGGITFTNNTQFDSRINVLLYTPCTADFTVNPSMNGQILALLGISATNQFTLNFDNLAALDVPGASYPSAPVVTVRSKTVSSG